ncbi:MAG TPA: hypothetical protein VHZ97_05545 [Pseudonocardiaceae bacterium]|nr:hypothetical protein [Pseudonocardiaceae bacterium]
MTSDRSTSRDELRERLRAACAGTGTAVSEALEEDRASHRW